MTTSAAFRRRRRAGAPLRRHRGASALAFTLVLLFVMGLGATFVSRNLVFEQRTSANQYRSTQAFEAAEAGLQWAEAQLATDRPVDDSCRAGVGGESFRERHLGFDTHSGALLPRRWGDASSGGPLRPGCVASGSGWACSCPATAGASLTRPPGLDPTPAFSVQFVAGSEAGTVHVVSTGCSTLALPCAAGATAAGATARVEVVLGVLGGLRVAPTGALTLAGRESPDRFFAAWFGLDKARWKAQPGVTRLTCASDCAAVLARAVAARAGSALLWIDGDLDLHGPVALGSADRPVVIVVDGTARLGGDVMIDGTLYAGSVDASGAGSGASVRGALLVEHEARGAVAAVVSRDAAVLARLVGFAGSVARLPGSWRDF